MAVLRSLAAYQPFRRAMPARPQGGWTLRFLLQDDRFPRAVGACLTEARAQLKGLPHSEGAQEACGMPPWWSPRHQWPTSRSAV